MLTVLKILLKLLEGEYYERLSAAIIPSLFLSVKSILVRRSSIRTTLVSYFHVLMVNHTYVHSTLNVDKMTLFLPHSNVDTDHIFRTPYDLVLTRLSNMSTESSAELEDKEVVM